MASKKEKGWELDKVTLYSDIMMAKDDIETISIDVDSLGRIRVHLFEERWRTVADTLKLIDKVRPLIEEVKKRSVTIEKITK